MDESISSWPSGVRDTTEFPSVDISISISEQMRDHIEAFLKFDNIDMSNYDLQRDVSGWTEATNQRLRSDRIMYERMGLIYRDGSTMKLSRLGVGIRDLQSTLEAYLRPVFEAYKADLLNGFIKSAVDVLARYQLRNPVDGESLPASCDVQPYLCIWKAMRELDNKINTEEMNRVILRITSMSQLDEAINRIRVARTKYGNYQGIPSTELDMILGPQVHTTQPTARIAPWFSAAGWGGLIIETKQRSDKYRWLTPDAIPVIDMKLSDPPTFFDTDSLSDWWSYFIGNESESKSNTDTFRLMELPSEFRNDYARRYITSLLAKPFVILTGNSGTGKTRICKRFAKFLEVMDEDGEPNWLLVPVGADWTDNTKVLGFYNPLADGGKGAYEETGILKLIRRANAHPDVPYFLILDEMNLSHVERYFSDFLSHMETMGDDNLIALDGYESSVEGDSIKAKVAYPQNLFVIGTVNIDETTYMFSPKVLDRANVIEFKPSKDDVLAWFALSEDMQEVPIAATGIPKSFLRFARDIREGKDFIDVDDSATITATFDRLYDALEDCGFEFAYRTVREVRRYINAAHAFDGDGFELNRSIDEQIVQKVLPKLHGNRREIGGLLDKLAAICDGELSAAKISQMQSKLANVQYASFI